MAINFCVAQGSIKEYYQFSNMAVPIYIPENSVYYSCSTSSSKLDMYPCFNIVAVLYLFPITNLNFVTLVILDTMSLL